MNKVLDVWPNRPNQELADVAQVFTERASRKRGGELFIRDDYTGQLVKYTTVGVQLGQKSIESQCKKQLVCNNQKPARKKRSKCSNLSARTVPTQTTTLPQSKSIVEKKMNKTRRSTSLAHAPSVVTCTSSDILNIGKGDTSIRANVQSTTEPHPQTLSPQLATRAKTPRPRAPKRRAVRSTSVVPVPDNSHLSPVKKSYRGQRTTGPQDKKDDAVGHKTATVTSAKKQTEDTRNISRSIKSKDISKKMNQNTSTVPPSPAIYDFIGESSKNNRKRKTQSITSPHPKFRRTQKTTKASLKAKNVSKEPNNRAWRDNGNEQYLFNAMCQPNSPVPIGKKVEQVYFSPSNVADISDVTAATRASSVEPTDSSRLAVAIWPLVEKPEFFLSRVDAGIRSLPQFDERHSDSLWTVLNLADLDDLIEMEVIRNINDFYDSEVVPAIFNFRKYMDHEIDSGTTTMFHDDNHDEYEDFIDDDNDGTVTIPLSPRPEVFPFQMFKRMKLRICQRTTSSTPSTSTKLVNTTFSNLVEESRRQMSDHQRQMNMFRQRQQELLNNLTAFPQPTFRPPFLNIPTTNIFAPPPNLFPFPQPQFNPIPHFPPQVFNVPNLFNLNRH